ncbi:MAG TPA: glutamate--cysteine ligase [Acidimicrobiia bacterium]|nr:glutamate--cysteine ligase [Acidimicrobiia bacterium]
MDIVFNASAGSSLGVEVELQIVDRETRELRSGASKILTRLESRRGDPHPKAKNELIESNIELITGICSTVAEARSDLEGTLAEVAQVAHELGLALLCAGTHPFSDWAVQDITPNERYNRLVDEVQWPARRMAIFGIHTHVGVRSAEKAIAIANALTGYIPHFLALSASSPWFEGRDTGLASSRTKVFEGLPTAGLPQLLGGWDEFEELMTTLISAKAISSIREIWWDIRPHPNFGTVELRICDGLPTMTEIVTVAALAQCLVDWMDSLIDRGYKLPCPKAWIVGQNKWRAARHGIDAEIIVDEQGKLAPLRGSIVDLVDDLTPVARRLSCEKELDHARRILDHGPSYLRQRRWVEAGGTLVDVVDGLIGELRSDEPG